jgi:imidazolonepropionase-like amidohydrolase
VRSPTAIGLGASKGRLRAGYDADLLFVGGDLLDDVDALRDVCSVVLRDRTVRDGSGAADPS